jgi:hypothetical protein
VKTDIPKKSVLSSSTLSGGSASTQQTHLNRRRRNPLTVPTVPTLTETGNLVRNVKFVFQRLACSQHGGTSGTSVVTGQPRIRERERLDRLDDIVTSNDGLTFGRARPTACYCRAVLPGRPDIGAPL